MVSLRWFAVVLVVAAGVAAAAQSGPGSAAPTEKRVALVIGNGAYANSPLRNPVNDAQAMSTTLRGLGFDVHPEP